MVKPNEPEFEQAKDEIYSTLTPLFDKQPHLKDLFEIVQIPERIIQFRVLWEDDKGKIHANNGFRVQFNSALGPYKGGLRLHPTVTLSILKFLGFEQTFKNALTGLNMGGGKGGSDFDPKGKTDNEIRRFCVSFMTELCKHIGDNTDIPAGDIGVSTREIGFMFGQYKKIRNEFSGILTGKGGDWGGSHIRPEATGYGLIYFVQEMIKAIDGTELEKTFEGKTVAISGAGNVAQYAAIKVLELGGKVVSLSDSKGALISKDDSTFTKEEILKIQDLKHKHGYLKDAGLDKFTYVEGKRPWTEFEKLDIALPCATQNEVSKSDAEALIKAGVKYIAEGSNMGSEKDAIEVFEKARESKKAYYAPGKASNCGGVAVSGLEMAQNSARIKWSPEEVDARLKTIMSDCFKLCYETAKEYHTGDGYYTLVGGANMAGFLKVANAMISHGDFY